MFQLRINKQNIDWRGLILGSVLNILVIIVAILLYNAYIVQPKIKEIQVQSEGSLIPSDDKSAPTSTSLTPTAPVPASDSNN